MLLEIRVAPSSTLPWFLSIVRTMQVFRNSHSLDLNDTKGNKAPNMVKFKDLWSKEDTKKWYYASLGERRLKKEAIYGNLNFQISLKTLKQKKQA